MPWILLVIAGGLEVIWAIGLKESHGFSWLVPSLLTVAALLCSFGLLAWALRHLSTRHLSTGHVYAALSGLGVIGVGLTAAFWLYQGMNVPELGIMMAIVGGIVGLKFMTNA